EGEGEILAILKENQPVESVSDGESAQMILDRTSFYAEQGGQIGDRGEISFGDARFEVSDAQYVGEAIAHIGTVRGGTFSVGDLVQTSVSPQWRREIRRHHTSAHLLQRALKDVLGEDVAQAGSWVGIDRMRFDFRWPHGALSAQQRRSVTARVNEMIRDDTPLRTEVLPIEEAHARGAISMFGEKYGERVRVVTAGPSIEFCGGTHSHSTGELGIFIITNESSIGSGIRRIESCVSEAAEAFVDRQQSLVSELSSSLSVTPQELGERINRLQQEVRELQNEIGEMRSRIASADAQRYVDQAERVGEKTFVGAVVSDADGDALRHLTSAIRRQLRSGVIALAGVENSSVSLVVSASEDLTRSGVHAGNLVKLAAPLVEGRGGGQALLAQGGGRRPEGAEQALRAIRDAFFQAR
ncbi:MAG: alanine--tRNA ligase, partial [Candidatus Eremiobacteraeota bacterium]|nr:alanine--tRNA ligase [Candidatus Eremiobacteraeota bacterium]